MALFLKEETTIKLKLLGINGSVTTNSRTAVVIETALEAARSTHPEVEIELLDLGQYDLLFCDGRDPHTYPGDTGRAIRTVVEADAVIIGTPVYRTSLTGALKNLFDLIPNDALLGKAVGLIATGGSDHHMLALEYALRPIVSFFRANTVPGTVYAQNAHFNGAKQLVDEEIISRTSQLGQETVTLAYRLRSEKDGRVLAGPPPPEIRRKPTSNN